MFDPVVHAALVVVFAWLVQLLFKFLGLDLGNDVATGLAQVIVTYILSLFGWSLYAKAKIATFKSTPTYHPPFS
jgi:ABC-type uncharacterized transport system permease subunit